MSQQPQPAKIQCWVNEAQERIAYLAQQEKQALIDIDALPVGSHIRAAHWSYIKELGYRKNELQDMLNKFSAESDSDLIPDLSSLSDADKKKFVQGFIDTTAEAFLKVYVMLDMKWGIECGVINEATGDSFALSFKKKPTKDLSAPASPVEEVGQKLKLIREKEGLTPKDVLYKTGISLVYLDRLENGELKSHSASVLYKLSELYKIDLKPLLVEAGVIIKKSAESKPSPVIEIVEQKGMQKANPAVILSKFLWVNMLDTSVVGGSLKGGFSIDQDVLLKYLLAFQEWVYINQPLLAEINSPASHPAPSPIVGEREEDQWHPQDYSGRNALASFYCTKPSTKPCSRQCSLCAAHDPAPIEQALPEESRDARYAVANFLLQECRAQLASARTLITKIKRWDVYQEPADECDKWLRENPEIGKEGEK